MAHADPHGHGDPAAAHDAHDDHHEPPPPPEPETPSWLTAAGAALFLVAGGVFLLMNVDPAAAKADSPARAPAISRAATTATAVLPRPASQPQVVVAQPAGAQGVGARPMPAGINPQQLQLPGRPAAPPR